MNITIDSLAFTRALGWTVVHSVWQIACIFLIFKIIGWGLGHRNLMRYHCALLAMGACALWSASTFGNLYQSFKTVTWSRLQAMGWFSTVPYPTAILAPMPENAWRMVVHWLDNHSVLLGWCWCLGVAALSLRLAGGYWLAGRLRQRSQPMTDQQTAHGKALAKQMGITRRVHFLENSHISEPLTLGFWKPVILFPMGLLLQLTPAQVEVLLLHELAHIRRHDYLVNLFQLALEVGFFYHPLFWLMSREARNRREYCCDDLVLHHSDNPLLYARTLTALKITSLHHQNAFAMSATGKNDFTIRIQRLLGVAPERAQRSQSLLVLLLLAGLVAGAGWSTTTHTILENSLGPSTINAFPTLPARDTVVPAVVRVKPAPAPKPAKIATPASQPNPAPAASPASTVKPVVAPKPAPDPVPSLGGRHSGSISKQEFLARPEVTLLFERGQGSDAFKVISYEVTVLPKDQDPLTFMNYDPLIREEILHFVSAPEADITVYIDNIRIKVAGEVEPRNLGGLVFKIKA